MTQNTKQRIVVALLLIFIAIVAAICEFYGFHAVRYMGILVIAGMVAEMLWQTIRLDRKVLMRGSNPIIFGSFVAWLMLMLVAMDSIGTHPWIILLMLLTICAADMGSWFFGNLIGGDKMWARISPNKTWAGQIAGIACGTATAVVYGLIGTKMFMAPLFWMGMGISLMSQYGDITASWIKRRMGIKDFGTIFPGHGGFLDRFDGWIYALPIIWLILM